jgi:N-acetylneuraminate synthase
VIEKHFTLGNHLPGPDHGFAVEPKELKALVQAVRDAEAVLGAGAKEVLAVENELRHFARRSVFSARAIAKGETLSADNILVLRNGVNTPGLPPSAYPTLLGRKAARDVAAGAPITAETVDDGSRLP